MSLEGIERLRLYARNLANGIAEDEGPIITAQLIREYANRIEEEIERDYMRLPVGKDGAFIRLGETVYNDAWPNGKRVYEICFTDNDGTRIYDDGGDWGLAGVCSHTKPRTLEDVLDEYHAKRERLELKVDNPGSGMTLGEFADAEKALTDEYAAEIREMMGGGE